MWEVNGSCVWKVEDVCEEQKSGVSELIENPRLRKFILASEEMVNIEKVWEARNQRKLMILE
jgi:hypothetical protein